MSRSLRFLISLFGILLLKMAPAAEYAADINTLIGKAEARTPAPVIARTEPVTKESYLKTAEFFFKSKYPAIVEMAKYAKPYPDINFYLDAARWTARWFNITGNDEYAQTAVKCLSQARVIQNDPQAVPAAKAVGWHAQTSLYWVDKWLKRSPAYTPEAQGWMRDFMLKTYPKYVDGEYGSMNRTFIYALQAETLLALAPNAPDADKWRTYNDKAWNAFWEFRETDEDSDEYNALAITLLMNLAEVRGVEKAFWSDPGVKRMMERFLYRVSPMGAYPHHPDSMGFNVPWGHYIYIFEACAAHYKDGRYKWAAHRLYDYSVNRIEKIGSWAYSGELAAWSLMKAYQVADDTVAEKPRDKDIVVIQRQQVVQRPWEEITKTKQWFDITAGMMPDKLLFTGGHDRDSMSMLVDVSPNVGHSHDKRPVILNLVDKQSVLLMSLGYLERNYEDHNIPVIRDYEGYPIDTTPYNVLNDISAVKRAEAVDMGPAGYGIVQLSKYMGYPADLLREILFIKNVGVVIKDTLTLTVDLRLRWGDIYRVRNLGPDYGPNWINSYLGEWIPVRALGKNCPVLTRWRNTPRDLLIYFLPDMQGTLEVVNDGEVDKTLPLPLRVQYTLRQSVQPNAPVSMTTLLLPHAPGAGKPFADKVKLYVNEPARTVFEFTDESGVRHLVALNAGEAPINIGGLQTEGKAAYVRLKDGKAVDAALYGGKKLSLGNKSLLPLTHPVIANVVPAGK
ncbi:MAG: hypothetical protein ACYC7E_00280 [Armatimonadota bacterium]